MARTIQRRRTVTRTVRSDGASQVKQNLENVADELQRVRDQAQQEVSALERIRGMLDTGHLVDLMRTIEELEERIDEMETDRLQSNNEADRLQDELEAEQERLQKLWDAYKTQEDELERVKRDYPLLEEKLFERERTIETLRRELSRLEPLAKYKNEYEALAEENDHLNGELDKAEDELDRAAKALEEMQKEVVALRAKEGDGLRAKELEQQLEEERERLAKLYRVYQDQEDEKKDLEARLAEWEKWFSRARHAFEETGSAPATAPIK